MIASLCWVFSCIILLEQLNWFTQNCLNDIHSRRNFMTLLCYTLYNVIYAYQCDDLLGFWKIEASVTNKERFLFEHSLPLLLPTVKHPLRSLTMIIFSWTWAIPRPPLTHNILELDSITNLNFALRINMHSHNVYGQYVCLSISKPVLNQWHRSI